jgi:hypothetical protein
MSTTFHGLVREIENLGYFINLFQFAYENYKFVILQFTKLCGRVN